MPPTNPPSEPSQPPISTFPISPSTAEKLPIPPPDSPSQTATATTPQEQEQDRDTEAYRRFFVNSSIAVCVATPLLMLTPPRKLDLYTFGLGITFFVSAGFVLEQKTGRGLLWHLGSRLPSVRAREEARRREEEVEAEGLRRAERDRRKGPLEKVWMGGERDDWVEERKRKEQEALDEGRGYGGLIADYIGDVWRRGKKDEEGGNDGDGQGKS